MQLRVRNDTPPGGGTLVDPVVLFASIVAVMVYPGGVVLYLPAMCARVAHLVEMRAQQLPSGRPLIGTGTVIALLACAVAAAQLPLPGNLLTSSIVVAHGSYTDVAVFLVASSIALVASVRNRLAPSQMLSAGAAVLALLVLAIHARSLTFAAVVETGGSHAALLHVIAGIVYVLVAPGLLSVFNSRIHLTAPLTVTFLLWELIVALAILPAFATWVAWVGAVFVLLVLGGAVWKARKMTVLVRITSIASILCACVLMVIGVKN
ncbi:MAG: hypothetical protein ACP5OR_03525 [Candidatus Dormibacteria bacterium]